MNSENILKKISLAVRLLPEEEKEKFDLCVEQNKKSDLWLGAVLADIRSDLLADIRASEAKKSGRGSAQKAALRILKMLADARNMVGVGAITTESEQFLPSIYSALILKNPLPVDEATEKFKDEHERFIKNCKNIIENAQRNEGGTEKAPTVAELKAYIKECKSEGRNLFVNGRSRVVYYDFAPQRFNAQYLCDCIEALDDNVSITFSKRENCGAYLQNENGSGVILPILPMRR